MLTNRFFQRIELKNTTIDLDHMPIILRHIAKYIPFENIDVIDKTTKPLSLETIAAKILTNHRGGLCYEINTLLFEVLRENNLNVNLISAVIFDETSQAFSKTGYTHTIILLEHQGLEYLIDAGFGNNIPLIPVPLNGDLVNSTNGAYKIVDHQLYMKRSYRDEQFKLAYRFKRDRITCDQLRISQQIIEQSEDSMFNKRALLTRCTEDGTVTLSENNLVIMKSGEKTSRVLTEVEKQQAKKDYFYQ